MKRTGPTKSQKIALIRALTTKAVKDDQPMWQKIAKTLSAPRRNQVSVNVQKLSRLSKAAPKKTLIVCGKVLSGGLIAESVDVVAFEYSASAVQKIEAAKGKAMLLSEWMNGKPKIENTMLVK
jgi:large subunit ribosomal protein L18e